MLSHFSSLTPYHPTHHTARHTHHNVTRPPKVVGLALTRDGLYAVTVGLDRTLCLWDLRTARLLGAPISLGAGLEPPTCVAVTPDSKIAIVGHEVSPGCVRMGSGLSGRWVTVEWQLSHD